MSIPLSPENEAFLAQLVADQEYTTRQAALDDAVSLLRQRREIISAVQSGVRQVEAGNLHEYGPDDLQRFLHDVESRRQQRHFNE